MKTSPTQLKLFLAIACALGAPLAAAQLTDISNEPLAQPAADVKPNIVLILDDSGSMTQQYTPDYLGRKFGGSNALCFDTKDSGSPGNITGSLKNCEAGDVPIHTPEINTQYYNPEIRYYPAVNYDGTSKNSMTAANTSNWTAVPTDAVSLSTTAFQRDTLDLNGGGSSVATENLVSGYPDRVWCMSTADTATDTARCKSNSGWLYPDDTYGYGLTTGGNIKYKSGAAYYYRLATTEYCTDQNMTNCVASTVPVTVSGVDYFVPAPVRYCRDSTLASCQAKYKETGTTYTYPKFAGNVNPGSTGVTGSAASGTVTLLTQKDTQAAAITGIYVGGVNIISGTINLSSGFGSSLSTTADTIRDRINSFVSSPDFTATAPSNQIVITAGSNGPAFNGQAITMTFNVTSQTAATMPAASVSGTSNGDSIDSYSVTVGSTTYQLINSQIVCSSCGSNNSQRNTYMRNALVAAINARTAITGFSAATSGSDEYTLTAPQSLGSAINGIVPVRSDPGMTVDANAFANGRTVGDVDYSATTMSGGADDVPALAPYRQNVGSFTRVDIVPFLDPPTNSVPKTFTKYSGRSDCAGVASCTYEEEMTNFANWYAYYRSRMQMAKTAIGRAFVGVAESHRVGFITINPSGDIPDRFLAVDDFRGGAGNQRDLWYQWLYKQATHGSTPLREALSRVGRYYAGKQDGINTGMPASPIQLACQPNYAILTTDGYWNGNPGRSLTDSGTGSTGGLGNHDNTDSGYSLRSEARYDGGLAGSTNTLADVALYYYKNDLRTDLSDFVPTSTRDPAAHQHMTTFTVGLGLAGQLTFDPNYESGSSPDFERLKTAPASGGLDWPVPAADSETALDDLWHAAVNGRGKFFSASDPTSLANAITESLNAVAARVGAGAAAATSNLQPVAGDNFAFTAQYETVTWIGDLKAQTIDLSTGAVATRSLWSAAARLDGRAHTTRRIYTLDTAGTETPSTPAAPNNKLKSFCYPGAPLISYPTCNDGTGLSATELNWFEPLTASASPSNQAALVQSPPWAGDGSGRNVSATREKLIDFIRGDRANEMRGGATTTDLFRQRVSVMGDIIDAQPAYAKGSPFNYRDAYYTEYKNTTNGVSGTRRGTVYVGANDGMLHAFETDPDNVPYFQTAGISTATFGDDVLTGTLSEDPVTGEGSERWAYIPGFILPHLKRLADSPYTHRYYTDGSPTLGDVCFGQGPSDCPAQANWRTILVAGANSGGRGYYALDVTDPDNPKALWEVRGGEGATCLTASEANGGSFGEDCNIGLSYGNPIIVKRKSDGKWVVLFTSGYNNVSPGDGKGYLYVVDAQTGLILQRLTTNAGSAAAPSGLGRINAWVDDATSDNTAKAVYGGDLLGNVWRFQFDNTASVPVNSVTKLATVQGPGGTLQPITVKPELGEVGTNKNRVIFFGTGKFIGDSDKATVARQSIYAIKDAMNAACSGTCTDPAAATAVTDMARSGTYPSDSIAGFTKQTLVASPTNPTTERTTCIDPPGPCPANPDFDSPTTNGWFVDLPDGGSGTNASERVNNDPVLQVGTLVVPSNVPTNDTCLAGGYGWLNFLDYKTGKFVQGAANNMASRKISSSLVVGINVVQLPGNVIKTIVTTADNQHSTSDTPTSGTGPSGKRISWRELFQEQ
jgi:type IV pilus assembly protein PilY1